MPVRPEGIEIVREFTRLNWNSDSAIWERLATTLIAKSAVIIVIQRELDEIKATVRESFFNDKILGPVTVPKPRMTDRIKKLRRESWQDDGWPEEKLQRVIDLIEFAVHRVTGKRFSEMADRENPFISK